MAGSGMSSDKRGLYGACTFGKVNGCMFDELEKLSAHVRMTRKPADRIAHSISRHCFFCYTHESVKKYQEIRILLDSSNFMLDISAFHDILFPELQNRFFPNPRIPLFLPSVLQKHSKQYGERKEELIRLN